MAQNVATKPTDSDVPVSYSVVDHLCDLCIQDKENVEATAFCKSCQEYMCMSCQKAHRRGAATKQHKLLTGEDMPKDPDKVTEDKPVGDTGLEGQHGGRKEAGSSSSMRAVYLEQLVVGSASDQYYAAVNALEVLPDDSLLVCDYGNYKVKLFDAEHELQFEVKLPAEPYGMSMLSTIDLKQSADAFEALVTLPSESCLQKIRVKSRRVKSGSKISLEGKLTTTLKCEKIMAFQGNFIVTAYDDMYFCLSVIDKTGKVIRSIYDEPKKSLEIFKSYYEIAVSSDERIIFITNKKSGCVGISTVDGSVLFRHKERGEANHYGISADPSGMVYVACCDTDKVAAISKTGKKVQDIVTLKDLKPSFVIYKDFGKKLFVGQANTNKILCYQIKP